MAGSAEGDMSGSWWGGWLQAAKEKSTAALEMVRKDLAEFTCTMQNDTGHAVEVTSTTLKESLKAENTSAAKEKLTKGLNTFLEGISKALVVPPDDEGQIPITAPSSDLYDRAKARLHAVQVDPDTYLQEPSGSADTYNRWCESFDLDSMKGEISELLVSKIEVRGLYTKLVPSRVSHVEFWRRYFYRLHQIDLDQARKEALMKRAERSRADDSIGWEDDWSGDEAAEDSGSDWEKLPRPNQQPSPTPSPALPPASTKPVQAEDSEYMAQLKAEESSPQQTVEGHLSSEGGFQDINLEDEKGNPLRGKTSVTEEKLSEASSRLPETSSVLPSDTEAACDTCVSQQEAETSPERLQPSPEENNAGAVKACEPTILDSVATSPPPKMVSSVPDLTIASAETEQELTENTSQNDHQQSAASQLGDQQINPEPLSVEIMAAEKDRAAEEGSTLKTTVRGDLVVVGSDHGSPVSNSSLSKGVSEMDDDWDEDLDLELTEEDMKAAEELAKKMGENINLEEDDWESWE